MDDYVVVEPFVDRDGRPKVALIEDLNFEFFDKTDELVERLAKRKLVTYDVRRIVDWPLSPSNPVVDVKLLWGGERTLSKVVRDQFGGDSGQWANFLWLDQRVQAHLKAAKTAKMAPPYTQGVPEDILFEWLGSKLGVVKGLYDKSVFSSGPDGFWAAECESRWSFILALRQIELGGIHVDEDKLILMLAAQLDPSDRSTLLSAQKHMRNGLVTSLLNPIGTKTGRLRYETGFNCLAIPKSDVRKVFTSRHEGGQIFTFDFNAVDFRCIVRAIGGEFAQRYEGADDFHARTASFIFKEVNETKRTLLKKIIYAYTYGGSNDTLARELGVESKLVQAVLTKLDEHIKPIAQFREALYIQSMEKDCMYVEPPGGRKVYVSSDDHSGKVLGLYAQTYSSYVVERATEAVHWFLAPTKSRIIFTVYDELVLDMHPDDFALADQVRDIMQGVSGGGWKVRVKHGRSYGEQDP